MVNLQDLYVGCQVRIVDQWVANCHPNQHGEMDRWLGQPMTVRSIHTSAGYVYMEEDAGTGPAYQDGRWRWFAPSIAEILQREIPPVDDLI